MCDYSLEGFKSRVAEVGDKLVVGPVHGFMRQQDLAYYEEHKREGHHALCLTCLKEEGTVLRINGDDYTYKYLLRSADYHDYLVDQRDCSRMIARLPMGTQAEVISIPSQMPKPTLDEKLGIDKLNAQITQEPDPAAVPKADGQSVIRRVIDRIVGND